MFNKSMYWRFKYVFLGLVISALWPTSSHARSLQILDTASSSTSVSLLDMVSVNYGNTARVVTAARNSSNVMELRVWDISNTGKIVARGSTTWGVVREIAMTTFMGNRVVTVVRNRHNVLRVLVWNISSNGMQISLIDDATDTQSHNIAANISSANRILLTAASSPLNNDNSRFVFWRLSENGQITVLSSLSAGHLDPIDLPVSSMPIPQVSAGRNRSGRLRLVTWWQDNRTRGGTSEEHGRSINEVRIDGIETWFVATTDSVPVGVHKGLTGVERVLLPGVGVVRISRWRRESFSKNSPPILNSEAEVPGLGRIGKHIDVLSLGPKEAVTVHSGFSSFRKLRRSQQGKPELHIIQWSVNSTVNGDVFIRDAAETVRGRLYRNRLAKIPHAGHHHRFVSASEIEGSGIRLMVWSID